MTMTKMMDPHKIFVYRFWFLVKDGNDDDDRGNRIRSLLPVAHTHWLLFTI